MVWGVSQKLFPLKCVFLEREIKNANLFYNKCENKMQLLAEMQREIEWNLKMLKRNGIYLGGNSFEKMYS